MRSAIRALFKSCSSRSIPRRQPRDSVIMSDRTIWSLGRAAAKRCLSVACTNHILHPANLPTLHPSILLIPVLGHHPTARLLHLHHAGGEDGREVVVVHHHDVHHHADGQDGQDDHFEVEVVQLGGHGADHLQGLFVVLRFHHFLLVGALG
ncbi:hypothetical protein BDY17DRAFT_298051 [Neohortaea acidophila]|uniref:Uncharacterized protein n=1 Tax=Neohortaea acidophila TaxID=245834 RepID=A0A6A6PUV1_9PEZI|nr:uncharacterized protein BDY17DRAFT_298051 [Neohortaea acidophila]KAF2483762.1 hypothetical protein BDY17DRAFT_298051 [Neohortaea acidophila]